MIYVPSEINSIIEIVVNNCITALSYVCKIIHAHNYYDYKTNHRIMKDRRLDNDTGLDQCYINYYP